MSTRKFAKALASYNVLEAPVDSDLDWLEALMHGLPLAAIDAAVEEGILTPDEIYEYVIPRRTLSHRKQKAQRLTLEESDRLARITRVSARAAETFGSEERGNEWLREPNGALGGQMPLDLLRGGEGGRIVEQILGRIDYGIYT